MEAYLPWGHVRGLLRSIPPRYTGEITVSHERRHGGLVETEVSTVVSPRDILEGTHVGLVLIEPMPFLLENSRYPNNQPAQVESFLSKRA